MVILFVRLHRHPVNWNLIAYDYSMQEDGSSCGVFSLAAAEQMARDQEPNDFKQPYTRYYRWRIVYALTNLANNMF
jgi:hypothetical protein